jgi:Zn-dependent protease
MERRSAVEAAAACRQDQGAVAESYHFCQHLETVWGWLWRTAALPLFRFRGILIEAHWSAAIPIVVYSGLLGTTRYLGRYPELSNTTITAMTIVSVLMVPVSILLHELGHTFQARREGLWAARITLWGLGGVSWSRGPRSPGADFRIVAAGPMVSAVLAVLFGALAWLGRHVGLASGVVGVLVLVAQFNAVTLAFNLVPMVPLDGGRLLNAALWRLRGPMFAFEWASRLGIVIASAVIAFGAVAPFVDVIPQGAGFNPGLVVMIQGAIMLYMTLAYRSAAAPAPGRPGRLLVGDIVDAAEPGDVPSPEVSIARFLESAAGSAGWGTAACDVVENGRTVGAISRGLAALVPQDRRAETVIGDVMLRKEDAVVLRREISIAEAFRMLQGTSKRGVIVDRGRVTAIILASDLADVLLRVRDAARGVIDARSASSPGLR